MISKLLVVILSWILLAIVKGQGKSLVLKIVEYIATAPLAFSSMKENQNLVSNFAAFILHAIISQTSP